MGVMSDASSLPDRATLRAHALAVYNAPGVSEACLTLQERFGVDVTIVLWCCWLGRHGVRIGDDAIRRAETAVAPWRETAVAPLRALRRRLKQDIGGIRPVASGSFRETIKAAEIEAEIVQLDHLERLAEHLSGTDGRDADRAGVARGNLTRYLAVSGVAAADVPRETVERIVEAAVTVV
jgi:uncharacterized protein (TIGR02444 family)